MKLAVKNVGRAFVLGLLFLVAAWVFRQNRSAEKLADDMPPVQQAKISESEIRSEVQALEALVSTISPPSPLISSTTPQNSNRPEEGGAKVDDEWQTFPRLDDFLPGYLAKPRLIELRRIFRHTLLNPGDSYIRPSDRQLLKSLVDYYNSLIDRAQKLRAQIAAKEIFSLIDQGMARGVPADRLLVKNYLASLPKEERERKTKSYTDEELASDNTYVLDAGALFPGEETVVTRHVGGMIYGATFRELPQTAKAEEIRVFLIMELAGAITSFFVQQAGCSTEQQAAVLSAMLDLLTQETPR